jgi:hypothetical protein
MIILVGGENYKTESKIMHRPLVPMGRRMTLILAVPLPAQISQTYAGT